MSGSTSWNNSAGGSWDIAANWSNGVPSPSCSTVITLPGTYTVTMPGGGLSAGLTLGGSSGKQTLLLLGTTQGNGQPQDSILSPSYSGMPFTIGANGIFRESSSGSNPGASIVGGSIINSGLIVTDPGTPGPNTFRDIRANVTNNVGATVDLRADTSTCACGSGGTWVNNGTFITEPGTTSTFVRTGAGISFTQASGTFVNGGTVVFTGHLIHTGGNTTGNSLGICGELVPAGPGTASFQTVQIPGCDGGLITGNIGAGDSVRVQTTNNQLDENGGTFTNFGTLTFASSAGHLVQFHGGQTDVLTNAGTLNFTGTPTNMAILLTNNAATNVAAGSGANFNTPITQAGGALNVAGALGTSGDLAMTGGTTSVDGTLNVAGNLTLSGGTLLGGGTVVAPSGLTNSGGTVHPGHSPGTLSITGSYTQGSGGALALDVAGTAPGSGFSQLLVSGKATIAGALNVNTPASQSGIFRVVNAGSLSGTFKALGFVGQAFAVGYDATGVQLNSSLAGAGGGAGSSAGPGSAAAATASVGGVSLTANSATITIACQGASGQTCGGSAALVSHETLKGKKPLAIAAAKKKKKKSKRQVKLITDASAGYSVPAGQSSKVTLTLNGSARKLLKRFKRLPATVTLNGKGASAVTFKPAKKKKGKKKH